MMQRRMWLLLLLVLACVSGRAGAAGVVYCETIAEAMAQSDGTVVGLGCRPIKSVGVGHFVMGEDYRYDTLKTYCTTDVTTSERVNRALGTMHTDGAERVLLIDSGPGYDPGGYRGRVQTAAAGTVAWAKTFADYDYSFEPLDNKVVTRVFPGAGYFYIQEPDRSSEIRVYDAYVSLALARGDVATIWEFEMGTEDGERVIRSYYTDLPDPVDPPRPLGIGNRFLGGNEFNELTGGPAQGSGLNNVGALVRTWGEVTAFGLGFFYIDDGAGLEDGSGSVGIRVEGALGYVPDVGSFVAIAGISGLKTINEQKARVLRLASSADLEPLTPARPHHVQAFATGSGEITVYWRATPGATAYDVYRGDSPGGENYSSALNGATPISAPTYPGGSVFSFTDVGPVDLEDYFYTVKAVSPLGASDPSDEAVAIPYTGAIPWASGDVYDITAAIGSSVVGYVDYVRACGPDGRIYDSRQAQPILPDWELIEGTNMMRMGDGRIVPIPDDEARMGYVGLADWSPGGDSLNVADGPYRRVKSLSDDQNLYSGCGGQFFVPNINAIVLHGDWASFDTAYTCVGSFADQQWLEHPDGDVSAGVTWNSMRGSWSPVMFSKMATRWTEGWPLVNMSMADGFMQGSWISMDYVIDYDVTLLLVSGWDEWFVDTTALLANAYGGYSPVGQMKRVHAISQGKPDYYRMIGSHVWWQACDNMYLRNWETGAPVSWTVGRTAESGSYPSSATGRISWTETSPYVAEQDINVGY